MSLESHRRATELFGRALDLEVEEQRAFVERESAGDAELAGRVLALLERDRSVDTGLDRPAMERIAPAAVPAAMPERVGPYRIFGILGAGGMGVVYRAEQPSPRREVALKVIRGGLMSLDLVRRFEKEARVLGRLDHQGIARVYDAGIFEGPRGPEPYVAMELVRGEPLLAHVAHHTLSVEARVELLARIGEAVAHAHGQGVVHRDLKPSNVLVTDDGQPKVLDFGVALVVRAEEDLATRHTRVGELVGTLPYMSPEQLGGLPGEVDERSDVYGLGVIAYQVLTGCLPHDLGGLAVPAAARVVSERDPPRLGDVVPALRGDLEAIVGKALEKERALRYASARAFVADLRRYLRREPVEAVPPSRLYYLRRFARRNPALTTSLVAGALVLLLGTAVSIDQARRAEKARDLADEEAIRARHAAEVSTLGAARISAEHAEYAEGRRLLASIPESSRGWVWHWIDAWCDRRLGAFRPGGLVRAVTFLPEGRRIAVADEHGTLWTWEPDAGSRTERAELGTALSGPAAFSPDGSILAGVHGDDPETLTLWKREGFETIAQLDVSPIRPIAVVVGPGAESVLVEGASYFLWEPSTGELRNPYLGGRARGLTFSADGTRADFVYNPGNDAPGWHNQLDVRTGTIGNPWRMNQGEPLSMALAPDGRIVLGLRDKRVIVADPAARAIRLEMLGSLGPVVSVAFDGRGERAASCAQSGNVRLWDTHDGRPIDLLSGNPGGADRMQFSPDGSRLLAATADEVSVWSARGPTDVLRGHRRYVYSVHFLRGGRRLLSQSFNGELRLWDAASFDLLREIRTPGPAGSTHATGVGRDGDLVAVARGKQVRLLDGDTLETVKRLENADSDTRAFAFTPDGKRLLANTTWQITLWDVETGRIVRTWPHRLDTWYPAVAVSPDGTRYAASEGSGAVVLDAATLEELFRTSGPTLAIESLAFSPDGRTLASGSVDKTVRLWDARTGAEQHVLTGHADRVYALAFSPDGSILASGSNDTRVRLWDPASGEELALLVGHDDYVFDLAFDPDGSRLVSASGDGTLHVWDTRRKSLRRPQVERVRARRAAFAGRAAVVQAEAGTPLEAARVVRADASLSPDDREAFLQALLLRLPSTPR